MQRVQISSLWSFHFLLPQKQKQKGVFFSCIAHTPLVKSHIGNDGEEPCLPLNLLVMCPTQIIYKNFHTYKIFNFVLLISNSKFFTWKNGTYLLIFIGWTEHYHHFPFMCCPATLVSCLLSHTTFNNTLCSHPVLQFYTGVFIAYHLYMFLCKELRQNNVMPSK